MVIVVLVIGHELQYLWIAIDIIHKGFHGDGDVAVAEEEHELLKCDFGFVLFREKVDWVAEWCVLDAVQVNHPVDVDLFSFISLLSVSSLLFIHIKLLHRNQLALHHLLIIITRNGLFNMLILTVQLPLEQLLHKCLINIDPALIIVLQLSLYEGVNCARGVAEAEHE